LLVAGGDLELHNIPGYGVDAYLTLRRLDSADWAESVDGLAAVAATSPPVRPPAANASIGGV
jgi:hypothetical protein